MTMPAFTLDEFNTFLKAVMKGKTFKAQESPGLASYEDDTGHEAYCYIDFLNLFCLLNGVRNGAHLDQIQSVGQYSLDYSGNDMDDNKDEDKDKDEEEEEEDEFEIDYEVTITHDKNTLTESLMSELTRLSLTRCPWLKFHKHYELTIWNTDKVSNAAVLNSWAFEGDCMDGGIKSTVTHADYWKNTALLLGNDKGYPTMTSDPTKAGIWMLRLVINVDGQLSHDKFTMAGGCYDKTNRRDLDSIRVIRNFMTTLIDKPLYHPDGKQVSLHSVSLMVKDVRKA